MGYGAVLAAGLSGAHAGKPGQCGERSPSQMAVTSRRTAASERILVATRRGALGARAGHASRPAPHPSAGKNARRYYRRGAAWAGPPAVSPSIRTLASTVLRPRSPAMEPAARSPRRVSGSEPTPEHHRLVNVMAGSDDRGSARGCPRPLRRVCSSDYSRQTSERGA